MPGDRVRCPACREAAPDDAAWCSRCGAALAGEVLAIEPAPAAAPPARAPRRPWRAVDRRVLVAGAAAALVVAAAVAAGAGGGGGDDGGSDGGRPAAGPSTTPTSLRRSPTTTAIPPVFLPEKTGGVRLLLARGGSVDVVDLDGKTVARHELPELPPQNEDLFTAPGLARRGDHLVFQGDGATFAVPLDFSAPARRLGGSALFLPSAVDDRVWLFAAPDGGPAAAREVDVAGRASGPSVPLPPDWSPQAVLDGGLLLARGDRFQVWDPATGDTRFASEPGATAVASSGTTVVWRFFCDGPFCPVHLTDIRTGRDRTVHLADSGHGFERGAFSPDGRTLAAFTQRRVDQRGFVPALVLVDVQAGTWQVVDGAGDYGALAWSASGQWVFTLGFGGGPPTVRAYRVGSSLGLPVELDGRAGGFALVAW